MRPIDLDSKRNEDHDTLIVDSDLQKRMQGSNVYSTKFLAKNEMRRDIIETLSAVPQEANSNLYF